MDFCEGCPDIEIKSISLACKICEQAQIEYRVLLFLHEIKQVSDEELLEAKKRLVNNAPKSFPAKKISMELAKTQTKA